MGSSEPGNQGEPVGGLSVPRSPPRTSHLDLGRLQLPAGPLPGGRLLLQLLPQAGRVSLQGSHPGPQGQLCPGLFLQQLLWMEGSMEVRCGQRGGRGWVQGRGRGSGDRLPEHHAAGPPCCSAPCSAGWLWTRPHSGPRTHSRVQPVEKEHLPMSVATQPTQRLLHPTPYHTAGGMGMAQPLRKMAKHGVSILPSNSAPSCGPKRNESICPRKSMDGHVHSSISHHITTEKDRRQLRCPSAGEWINRMCPGPATFGSLESHTNPQRQMPLLLPVHRREAEAQSGQGRSLRAHSYSRWNGDLSPGRMALQLCCPRRQPDVAI